MSDVIDEAQALADRLREAALAAVRTSTAQAGTDECEGCGNIIPRARRAAVPWARTCFDCQTAVEREQKGWGR